MTDMTPDKMTEEMAKKVIKSWWLANLHSQINNRHPDYMLAQGFLAGIEYEREAAKGLVEALEALIKEIETAESMDCFISYESAVNDLAAYKARTEKG